MLIGLIDWRCVLFIVLTVFVSPTPLPPTPFRDHFFLLRILPQISQKNERGIRPKCTKNTKIQTVLNEQTTHCFKRWLTCQLASFEALLSLEKTIHDPTLSWSAVPFCVLSLHKNDIRPKLRNFLCVSYHIGGTCPVKEFSWWCIFGTKTKAATHIPIPKRTLTWLR